MRDPTPTDRELEALKVLWTAGSATVREICDVISRRDQPLAYTTVLSLLQVMEQKGLVGHRRAGRAYEYFPKIERERTFRRLAAGFLDKVFDGAMDEFLVHALRSRRISATELDDLQRMISEARDGARPQGKKGKRR